MSVKKTADSAVQDPEGGGGFSHHKISQDFWPRFGPFFLSVSPLVTPKKLIFFRLRRFLSDPADRGRVKSAVVKVPHNVKRLR